MLLWGRSDQAADQPEPYLLPEAAPGRTQDSGRQSRSRPMSMRRGPYHRTTTSWRRGGDPKKELSNLRIPNLRGNLRSRRKGGLQGGSEATAAAGQRGKAARVRAVAGGRERMQRMGSHSSLATTKALARHRLIMEQKQQQQLK